MEKIYVCGPTVWNDVHIGNLRPIMTFDILNRIKTKFNKNFIFVHNITDIDDKIIKKAIEENKSEKEISEFYFQKYLNLLKIYNINQPNHLLKVTDNLDLIINFIQKLIDQKIAYEIDGNVFFDISKHNNYGKISNQNLNEVIDKEEQKIIKKNPIDFTLWKKTNLGIQFDSPFGKGRPGWHTECVALISKIFEDNTIDIHGGGIDLIFPHHENENAQFEAIFNKSLTKKWLHTGHLNWQGEKMSKSLGNVINAEDFAQKYDVDIFRNIILNSTISGPINFTDDLLINNQKIIEKYTKKYNKFFLEEIKQEVNYEIRDEILNLFLDLKFAQANKKINQILNDNNFLATLVDVFKTLGFNFTNLKISDEDIQKFKEWQEAREKQDYLNADILREYLKKKNLI